jgi:large subunit ribosomal protein L10
VSLTQEDLFLRKGGFYMPSDKVLKRKMETVSLLKEEFCSAQTLIVADYLGLNVQEDTEMRNALRKEGVVYKVVKNTIAVRAAREANLETLEQYFTGPTAIAYSKDDVVAPAKVLQKYADKIEAFSIKGGVMEGAAITVQEIKTLAAIPSREVLYAKVVCSIASPIAGFAMILNAISEKAKQESCETVGALAVSK